MKVEQYSDTTIANAIAEYEKELKSLNLSVARLNDYLFVLKKEQERRKNDPQRKSANPASLPTGK
jgi:hypothetical protein